MLAHAAWIFLLIMTIMRLWSSGVLPNRLICIRHLWLLACRYTKFIPTPQNLNYVCIYRCLKIYIGYQHSIILFCKLPEAPPLESNVSPAAVVTASTGISVSSSVLGRGLADVNGGVPGSWVFVVCLVVGVVVGGLWSVMIVSDACTETLDLVALHNRLEPYEKRSAKKVSFVRIRIFYQITCKIIKLRLTVGKVAQHQNKGSIEICTLWIVI